MNTLTDWKRNTVLFLASQAISLFGTALVQYAIMWYITLHTQSGLMMTISVICGFLPTFFLSPFAGVWADRYNRKNLIVWADTGIALVTLMLAILFFFGYEALWLLFLVPAIRAVGTGIQTPAVSALLPQLVPGDQLTRVNATYGTIQSVVTLLAPMLSGALLTFASIEAIFLIDVVTAVIAVLILLFRVQIPKHEKATGPQTVSYMDDLRAGFFYINQQGYLKAFFLFSAMFLVLIAPAAFLTPLQVTRSFGADVWRLTAIEIVFSIGMMAGGVVMAAWGGFANKIHTMTLAVLLIGACTVALGVIPVFWLYLVVMGIVGVTIPVYNTPATVLLQHKVEENYLGRVFGVFTMITSSMMPMGMLLFGPVADFIRIELLLVGTGALLILLSLFLVRNPALIAAGRPAAAEEG